MSVSVQRWPAEWPAHLCFIIIGIGMTIHGVAMPFLIDSFRITLGTAGLLFFFRSLGYIAAASSYPWLSGRLGTKRHLGAGSLLGAMGLAFLPLAPSWPFVLLAALTAGLGFSTVDVGFNALLSGLEPGRAKRAVHWLHFSFSSGALIGPIILAQLYNLSGHWGTMYFFGAVLLLLFSVIWSRRTLPQDWLDQEQGNRESLQDLYRSPYFWLLLAAMFIYCGTEFAMAGWLATYLVTDVGVGSNTAALGVSLFWGGLTIGRALAGRITVRLGVRTFLLTLLAGAAAATTVLASVGLPWLVMLLVPFSGLFYSAVFPSIVLFGSALFPTRTGAVSGGLVTAAGLGAMAVPSVLGVVGEYLSLTAGLYLLVVCLLMAAALVVSVPKRFLES